MILCRHESGEPHLVLHAGLLHGITVGSTFEIFRTDLSDLQHPLASATVRKVETFISSLVLLDPTFLTSNKNRRVWYARLQIASGANFGAYCNDSNFLTRILSEDSEPRITVPVIAAKTPDDADLCLTVKDEVVFFRPREQNPSLQSEHRLRLTVSLVSLNTTTLRTSEASSTTLPALSLRSRFQVHCL